MLNPSTGNATIVRFIKPILVLVALFSFIKFIIIYGINIAIHKSTLDFPSFYWASDALFNNNISPYNIDYIQKNTGLAVFPFIYPPPSIIFFFPMSLFTYDQAFLINLLLNHLAMILLIGLLVKIFEFAYFSYQSILITILVYTSFPFMQNVYLGQINTYIIIFVLLFLIMRHKYENIACILLGISIIVKMYPAVILPLLLFNKDYRILIKTSWVIVFTTIIAAFAIPSFVWQDWWLNIIPSGGYGKYPKGLLQTASVYNQSLNGLFARIFTNQEDSYQLIYNPSLGTALTYVCCGFLFFITLFVTAKYINKNAKDALEKIVFVTMPLIFLIAPFSWSVHIVTIYPTMIYLIKIAYEHQSKLAGVQLLFLIAVMILFFSPIVSTFCLWAIFIIWLLMLNVIIKQRSLASATDHPQIAVTAH